MTTTLAINPISEITYSGGNQTLLTQAFIGEQYPTNEWCTYNQAKEIGGQVRKGEHGVKCRKAGTNQSQNDHGETVNKKFFKGFTAFNYAQIHWTTDADQPEQEVA